jgi:formate dehydrogenase subunit gamma
MATQLVKRVSAAERIVHWVHMLAFIVLALTGLGLYAKSFFGITSLFGGIDMSRTIHHYTGLVFIVTTFISFFQWFKAITEKGEDNLFDVARSYLDHSFHAKSGKINAGQKLWAWFAFLVGLVMGATGLAMWFPFVLGRGLQQWMYFLHNLCFIGFMLFIVVHFYLGTFGNPGTWRTMSRGTVSKAWAKAHHPNWDAEDA